MSTQHSGPASEPPSARDARAQAKSEKAYRKAMRPWFKKKRFIIPLGVVLLTAVSLAFGGRDGQSPTNTTAQQGNQQQVQPSQDEAGTTAALGTPVRDGAFEFTVGKPQDKDSKIGSGGLQATAQGKFVLVPVDVKNIGNEAQMLDSSSQKLIDSQGREFNSSHEIGALPDADKVFLENINPGNTVKAAPLLFDVPKDADLVTLELHDSPFSGGVKISLK